MATKAITLRRRPRTIIVRSSHRRKHGFTLPIAVIAGGLPGAARLWDARSGGISAISREASRIYLGFDPWGPSFNPGLMMYGTAPLALGIVIHKLVGGKLGVNRALARSGIPFFRI